MEIFNLRGVEGASSKFKLRGVAGASSIFSYHRLCDQGLYRIIVHGHFNFETQIIFIMQFSLDYEILVLFLISMPTAKAGM